MGPFHRIQWILSTRQTEFHKMKGGPKTPTHGAVSSQISTWQCANWANKCLKLVPLLNQTNLLHIPSLQLL